MLLREMLEMHFIKTLFILFLCLNMILISIDMFKFSPSCKKIVSFNLQK